MVLIFIVVIVVVIILIVMLVFGVQNGATGNVVIAITLVFETVSNVYTANVAAVGQRT